MEGRPLVGPEGGVGQAEVPEQLHAQLQGGQRKSQSLQRQRGLDSLPAPLRPVDCYASNYALFFNDLYLEKALSKTMTSLSYSKSCI